LSARRPASEESVRATLQAYADRGVFRDFSERQLRGGKQEFRFTWLTREPMVLIHDPATATLTFKELLPDVARASLLPQLLADVQGLVGSLTSRARPTHRRVDARRLRVECAYRRHALSIVVRVKGRHHAYAVQRGVNIVNEVFTLLHSAYPDYLWNAFGLSAE
jgi:hypothetical protein